MRGFCESIKAFGVSGSGVHLGVLGNNLYFLLIIILRNSKTMIFAMVFSVPQCSGFGSDLDFMVSGFPG